MITIAVLYYLYLIVVLVFAVYSLFNVYHLIRFGFSSWVNIAIMIAYIVISTAFIIYSIGLLMQIDWSVELLSLQLGTGQLNF